MLFFLNFICFQISEPVYKLRHSHWLKHPSPDILVILLSAEIWIFRKGLPRSYLQSSHQHSRSFPPLLWVFLLYYIFPKIIIITWHHFIFYLFICLFPFPLLNYKHLKSHILFYLPFYFHSTEYKMEYDRPTMANNKIRNNRYINFITFSFIFHEYYE